MKKLLVILQNAYGVEEGYEPSYEKESFRTCHTGKRLRNAIPAGLDINIINASPKIGRKASSYFKEDGTYVGKKIQEYKPEVILACGVNARKVVSELDLDIPIITMPHPAYRALTNETLFSVKERLENLL